MGDSEIAARLRLLDAIRTPTGRYRNQIVAVGETSVTVVSERTGNERVIPFRHIREWTAMNGCILQSIRIILGLEQAA
jgi:hypothetical protein